MIKVISYDLKTISMNEIKNIETKKLKTLAKKQREGKFKKFLDVSKKLK